MEMKKLAFVLACSTLLAGCASVWTATDYTPYVGDDTVYVGKGGAMEVMNGIEVWKQGLPHKPYKIVGMITGEILDGWSAEDWMMTACAEEAKKNLGHRQRADAAECRDYSVRWQNARNLSGHQIRPS